MNDSFDIKVRSAAIAGWWTLLIAIIFFLIQWIAYLVVVRAEPALVLTLWGPGATWLEVRNLWFTFLTGFKISIFLVAFILVWLTLWARQLRKSANAATTP